MIAPTHTFDEATPVTEPIEIRVALRANGTGPIVGPCYTVIASNRDGLVDCRMSNTTGGGCASSVSNLQSKQPLPRKAVPGWQVELIAWADGGIYTVEVIR